MDFISVSQTTENKQYIKRSRTQHIFLLLMIGALNTITPISIDMYLPAFPKIAADMHTSIGNVALSVSTYFLGFALGQILYGPLLDRFGRKRPLHIGLCLYIIATILCATCTSIEMLWLMRFIQAVSGCVASVAAMAMVLDFFPTDKSAQIISLLILILSVSPLLAPTAGTFIIDTWNWRFVFIVLAIIAALLLVVVFFFLPEGHQPDKTVSLLPKPIINGFKTILTTKQFYVYALAGTFSFAGLFVYVAGSPAVFMDEFHVSAKVYGAIFAGLSLGFIGSSQLNHILTKHFTNESILKATSIIQSITSILFLFFILNNWYNITLIIAFLFVLLACSGLTYPNAAAVAMRSFTKNAGTASSLLGFIQIGIGGIISAAVGMLHFKGSLAVSFVIAASSCIAFFILLLGERRKSN
ncbi:multidrug effflux MFS transporter [Ferruginibacter albus]|uniref:multidrug effflux MFS transporter n=1 Tax=Ferruginibacter albus TaxID=2875540 RepID=UPI001CC54826|nr:multidrug effflux MFS transporter [Ferruginibacter albus]UAY53264.1 multidrug effflux MFS transporter [Ferruginibacter albus]